MYNVCTDSCGRATLNDTHTILVSGYLPVVKVTHPGVNDIMASVIREGYVYEMYMIL